MDEEETGIVERLLRQTSGRALISAESAMSSFNARAPTADMETGGGSQVHLGERSQLNRRRVSFSVPETRPRVRQQDEKADEEEYGESETSSEPFDEGRHFLDVDSDEDDEDDGSDGSDGHRESWALRATKWGRKAFSNMIAEVFNVNVRFGDDGTPTYRRPLLGRSKSKKMLRVRTYNGGKREKNTVVESL